MNDVKTELQSLRKGLLSLTEKASELLNRLDAGQPAPAGKAKKPSRKEVYKTKLLTRTTRRA